MNFRSTFILNVYYELDMIQGSKDSVMNKLGKTPAFKEKF